MFPFLIVPVRAEPTLMQIFTYLGFTNVAEVQLSSFPAGMYNITLYAEFAGYADQNELSYYQVNTAIYSIIFTGPEGGHDYVIPPLMKRFGIPYQFGLSMLSPGPHRYFTENNLNPDGQMHSKVYRNLDVPSMYLIGFENLYGAGDRDYQDLVFSIQLQYYLDVISAYDTPGGEGWYVNGTTAHATLADGIIDCGNGTRRVFTNWGGDASGTNHVQSDPILITSNKSAIANWKTQYYMTVSSPYGSPSPLSGWYDKGTSIFSQVPSPVAGPSGTRYVCNGWTGTGSVPSSGTGTSVTFTLDAPSSITWNWKTQHLLAVLTNPAGLAPVPLRNPLGEAGSANSWWYDVSISVAVTAQSVIGYTFNKWNVDGVPQGSGMNPITITMNGPKTATAYYDVIPPLTVSITPPAATIELGESIGFASAVSGGVPTYTYQWYVNDNPVPGATLPTWTFTPPAMGTYNVYLRATDSTSTTVQSNTSLVSVIAPPPPIGGYSFSLEASKRGNPLFAYSIAIALLSLGACLLRRKKR